MKTWNIILVWHSTCYLHPSLLTFYACGHGPPFNNLGISRQNTDLTETMNPCVCKSYFPCSVKKFSQFHVFVFEIRRHVSIWSLQWRHNDHDGVSNHQPHDCLLNRLCRRRSKKTSKLRVTGLCVGNPPVTGEFPAQRASNAKNVSIWRRHHARATTETISMVNDKKLNFDDSTWDDLEEFWITPNI